jgi:hypothetical protein
MNAYAHVRIAEDGQYGRRQIVPRSYPRALMTAT